MNNIATPSGDHNLHASSQEAASKETTSKEAASKEEAPKEADSKETTAKEATSGRPQGIPEAISVPVPDMILTGAATLIAAERLPGVPEAIKAAVPVGFLTGAATLIASGRPPGALGWCRPAYSRLAWCYVYVHPGATIRSPGHLLVATIRSPWT